jgi:hypothetical protein
MKKWIHHRGTETQSSKTEKIKRKGEPRRARRHGEEREREKRKDLGREVDKRREIRSRNKH